MFRLFYLIAGLVLGLDILTKQVVYRSMHLGQSIPVYGEWFQWTYIHNAGAAFGVFQGNRWFFVGVSLLSVLVLVTLANSARYRRPLTLLALGLILGGAVGNLLDRLWLGVVIDFVNIGIGEHRWPFFNVADSGISVGVVLLAIQLLRDGAEQPGSVESEGVFESQYQSGSRRDGAEQPGPVESGGSHADEEASLRSEKTAPGEGASGDEDGVSRGAEVPAPAEQGRGTGR